jgi:alkyl sulfatase BDS1-like metallo-beta-lactamase superfamily hydrolase
MELAHGVLIHHPTPRDDPADLTVTLTRPQLLDLLAGEGGGDVRLEGDASLLSTLMALIDAPDAAFAVVTP